MTPVEAANLLTKLEEGHQAAWLSTHEVPWHSAEYESRFQNAAEVDRVFRDLMWETVNNGMRHPGEPAEEFAERAESEARFTDARPAGAETGDLINQQADAGMTPGRAKAASTRPLPGCWANRATPEGQAYARAFSDTAGPTCGSCGSAIRGARPHTVRLPPRSVPRHPRLARQPPRHLHPPRRARTAGAAAA
jgi:hypothetical protein